VTFDIKDYEASRERSWRAIKSSPRRRSAPRRTRDSPWNTLYTQRSRFSDHLEFSEWQIRGTQIGLKQSGDLNPVNSTASSMDPPELFGIFLFL